MDSELSITITHFINPHLFWFKIEGFDEQYRVLSTLEKNLEQLYKNKPSCDNTLRPQVGDKLAVNFIAWNKFIRAEVLQKAEFQQEEYIVWAIDYGFPLLTKKEYLRNLPLSLRREIGHIKIGGIANVYPAEQEYDDQESNLVLVKKDKWLQKTCNMLEKLLTDASSISFVIRFINSKDQYWGDLIVVNHKGNKVNALDYLLRTTSAIKTEGFEFYNNCSKFNSLKIAPWLSNDRNTKMKINTIKHNYIEHSMQMVATIIDEQAKRKVEDWQKRNEKKAIDEFTEMFASSCEMVEDNIMDDVTFDDSVSVAHNKVRNYIGKAGVLTKDKRNAYTSNKELSPSVLARAFQIDDMSSEKNDSSFSQPSDLSLPSSTNISIRLKRLAELRSSNAKNKNKEKAITNTENLASQSQELPLVINSNASSIISSVSVRHQKLIEMRKKIAGTEKINKTIGKNIGEIKSLPITSDADMKLSHCLTIKHNLNSTITKTKTLDISPYHHPLDQSILSKLNYSTTDNLQDNESEISVKNMRAKRLIAIRKKFNKSFTSINSEADGSVEPQQQTFEIKGKDLSPDNVNFELKPRIFSETEDNIIQLEDTCLSDPLPSVQLEMKNEKLKNNQSVYDSLNMIPAGFDITRLQTYKDEENHWHRKKTTRYDCIAHDNTTSINEFQNVDDEKLIRTESNHYKRLSVDSKQNSEQFEVNKIANLKDVGTNLFSNEMSTSTNSTILSRKFHIRRQLKSPTSQLSKIDKILQQHNVEKELSNTNILDLNLLNTSSSSQKSSKFSSNDSSSEINLECGHAGDFNIFSSSFSSSVDKIRNEKHLKNVCNYEALMEVKSTEKLPIIEGERKIRTKFIDHLVLAHSSIQLMPVENISDAPFLPEIHEEMRQMHVNKVYRIQVYSWSHVLRNNSLFVVNPPRSGKTWSYLPPLCSLLCCRRGTIASSYGPMGLILVASLKHVELVNSYCRRLMSGLKSDAPTCIPSYGMRNLIETKVQLLNGCGILVATPSSILRLLQDNINEPLFNSERLQHIVIDDMDIMMSRAQQDFENAMHIIFKIVKKNKYKKLAPQLIVTSRDWDGLMVKLIRKSNQPLLLIGDFLEAAVYGHATISIKFKSSSEKNETVLKFIKKMMQSTQCLNNRTLIICNNDEDVQNVIQFLQECGYPCLGYYNRSTELERVTVEEWKKKVSSQILVCTDARFCELQIQNVNNLIHYSMPTSWTRFTTRFSALACTYDNYVSRNFDQIVLFSPSSEHYAHSMILLDENNNLQLPRLVDFMRKHNQVVHDQILAVSKRVMIMREEEKIINGSHLCPQLLEFGECDEARCDNRHDLTRFDAIKKGDGIPCRGDIRIHILKVFSPTHYAVRLLYHKEPSSTEWVEVRCSNESLKFAIQLDIHYRNVNNLSLHWPPHVNDLCIYQYVDNFRRARIVEAPDFEKKSTNVVQSDLKVTLKLIDDGAIISSVKCNEIFVCDDKFKNFPSQAVDIRLMNIVPFDNERSWDSKTTKQVQKWIMEDIKSDYVIQASIDFSLANTIWVKNVVVMQKLTGINAYCQIVHLKKSLIEKKFGVLYEGDRKHIRDLAMEYGLLNVADAKVDEESDLDYQTYKNESTNLITFSSSNNTSTESVEHDLNVVQKISHDNSIQKSGIEMNITDEENLANAEKVYVPLPSNEVPETMRLDAPDLNPTQTEQLIVSSKMERWSKLPINEIVKVEIGDEGENGNWGNIFLQIIDKNSMSLFEELNDLITRHIDTIKSSKEKQEIYEFEPLHNCLVKYDNRYLRAKVYGVYGEKREQRLYKFFLCDYACFTSVKTEDLYRDFLYETTEEILTFTPFQAIHCTLAGIKWDSFTKRYQVTKNYLYACAVLENEKSNFNLPIYSYTILLYECENESEFSTALLFNKALLDNGITLCDDKTAHFLDYEICMENIRSEFRKDNKSNGEEVSSNDGVYTYEQLLNSIKMGVFDIELGDIMDRIQEEDSKTIEMIESSNKDKTNQSNSNAEISEFLNVDTKNKKSKVVYTPDSETDVQDKCTSSSNSIKSSISLSSTEVSNNSIEPPPQLKLLYKRPQTTWYQNDCMIFLSINAPDVKNYLLEITSKTVLFVAHIQGEKSVLHMNLLGSTETQYVSHEIKGVNVVIRLVKLVFEKWPRLLQESGKYSWLKYNLNALDLNEIQHVMSEQRMHTIFDSNLYFNGERLDDSNSDDDSERELYQTYNPILDNEDDCDPFSTI